MAEKCFKSPEEVGFCARSMKLEEGTYKIRYEICKESFEFLDNYLCFTLKSSLESKAFLKAKMSFYQKVVNLYVSEIDPIYERYCIKPLSSEKSCFSFEKTEEGLKIIWEGYVIDMVFSPFSVVFKRRNLIELVINEKNLMNFERYRNKNQVLQHSGFDIIDGTGLPLSQDLWEDKFEQFVDPIPKGPSSVGLDFALPLAKHLSGLAEHSDSVLLKDTQSSPYRFYNLDVFAYQLDSTASIYAAIPFVYSRTVGIYWANASETYAGISSTPLKNVHFYSECGNIDVYLVFGNSPLEVVSSFTLLTGPASFPPLFSLGYHQCRWNYYSQEEVLLLLERFNHCSIPVDAIWLDIEYTDNKNYFTWNLEKFPEPISMQDVLALNGKELVTIIDPHFRYIPASPIGQSLIDQSYAVKTLNDSIFTGECWSGKSFWVDFFNKSARKYWQDLYQFSKYKETTNIVHIWNDMNEPSVFGSCEITLPKSTKHGSCLEHREVHNLYGYMMQKSSFKGLLKRSAHKKRPFLLTRSCFAGSQKFGAVWTGDNKSTWEYMQASIPMCLNLASCGMSFCGADVCGFFGEASNSLAGRWYQLGAFLPFYRGHSHHNTKHREPWCFTSETLKTIQKSIKRRYKLLPYWYTLFYDYHILGLPVIRSMFLQHPESENFEKINEQFFIGDSLLLAPVLKEGQDTVEVFFPEGRWFDWKSKTELLSESKFAVGKDEIKVFVKGGSAIPVQNIGLSSKFMKEFGFVIALDSDSRARGKVFIDDGESFKYLNDLALWGDIEADELEIRYKVRGSYRGYSEINKIRILGVKGEIAEAALNGPGLVKKVLKKGPSFELVLERVSLSQNWTINLNILK